MTVPLKGKLAAGREVEAILRSALALESIFDLQNAHGIGGRALDGLYLHACRVRSDRFAMIDRTMEACGAL